MTVEERSELEQMTQSRTLPAGDVFRARLILMLADAVPYRTIQERLDTTAPTISRWKERFLKERVVGLLEIRHPGQKPTVITPALQAKVWMRHVASQRMDRRTGRAANSPRDWESARIPCNGSGIGPV